MRLTILGIMMALTIGGQPATIVKTYDDVAIVETQEHELLEYDADASNQYATDVILLNNEMLVIR